MGVFGFKGVKKALRNRIIPTVSFAAHALLYLVVIQNLAMAFTGVLAAAIGVPNQSSFRLALPDSH